MDTKKTGADRKRQERANDHAAIEAWKQDLMDDVDIYTEKKDGKTYITIDVSPETKEVLTEVFKAQGYTWDEYWRASVDKFIAHTAKLQILKAKHERGRGTYPRKGKGD